MLRPLGLGDTTLSPSRERSGQSAYGPSSSMVPPALCRHCGSCTCPNSDPNQIGRGRSCARPSALLGSASIGDDAGSRSGRLGQGPERAIRRVIAPNRGGPAATRIVPGLTLSPACRFLVALKFSGKFYPAGPGINPLALMLAKTPRFLRCTLYELADGVGFEPTVSLRPRRFSRPLP